MVPKLGSAPLDEETFAARLAASRRAPGARLLSNGRFRTLVTAAGTGAAWWESVQLSRWRGDPHDVGEGVFVFVREAGTARPLTQPERSLIEDAPAPGYAVLRGEHPGLAASVEIWVDAEAPLEWRRIRLRNLESRPRELELTTWVEVVLDHAAAFEAHPAFSRLFVQTEAEGDVVLARRRPREPGRRHPWLAHVLRGPGALELETDRARFLGRGRALANARALTADAPLSGTLGSVLDPVLALRRRFTLAPEAEVELVLGLAAGGSREEALAAVAPARPGAAAAAACARADAVARERLGAQDPGHVAACERVLADLLHGVPTPSRHARGIAGARRSASALLEGRGVRVEGPLVVCAEDSGMNLALAACAHWSALGFPATFVLVPRRAADLPGDPAPNVHVAPRDQLATDEIATLKSAADWLVSAERTESAEAEASTPPQPLALRVAATAGVERAPLADGAPSRDGRGAPEADRLELENGIGGFAAGGEEYVIRFARDPDGALRRPPLPWVNVLASPRFGALVSESGASCTWGANSRLHRITPWSNDPVVDPHGEALHLIDAEAATVWSPLPGPDPAPAPARYVARHGFGYSRFECEHDDLDVRTTTFVLAHEPAKILRVRVANRGSRARSLELTWSHELAQLGDRHDLEHARVEYAAEVDALLGARDGGEGLLVFSAAVGHGAGAVVGRETSRRRFVAWRRERSGAAAAGTAWPATPPPCASAPAFATRVAFTLPPGATREVAFVLGEAPDAEVAPLLERLREPGAIDAAEREVRAFWEDLLGRVRVDTPVPALDRVLNGWLAYQTLACRLWARTAFFQSGGAFGFRDQLQDALGLLAYDPGLARRQIVLNASHQFVEGDVLHWWHPDASDRGDAAPPRRPGWGIRTRFADDLLWLPWLAATYVERTGDRAVLDVETPFVTARALAPGEDEALVHPEWSGARATVYEHAARTIERSLAVGAHGLPLFGTGDWNDGMNRVGREGKGESVWMAFFLHTVIDAFAPLAEARGDARAARWRDHQRALRTAIETHAWDGDWYRRGYHDDGAPIGSRESDECRIDALAQAWAVLSGAADPARAARAMDAVEDQLVSETDGIVRLLTPPFDRSPHDPGYIQGYVPGVRENGGQYTHAALWVAQALARLGRHDRAARVLEMLSPVTHTRDAAAVARYGGEPYVVAADVYGAPPHVGRAGWTWYTGSSGWMIRVALESVLGVTMRDGRTLVIAPAIPRAWPGYRMQWRPPGVDSGYVIEVEQRADSRGAIVACALDGVAVAAADGRVEIPLASDGVTHHVRVVLG